MTSHQRSILAVALVVTQGVSVGLTYGILPVFLEPLEAAFSAPRTTIASGQILLMAALVAGSMLTGVAIDRGHARWVMMAGALLLGAAQIVAAFAPNLWMLGLAALMGGCAVPSIGPLASASLITRTFADERGRALGLMSMGPPLGSGLFAALAGWALVHFGWREAFQIFAVIAFVVLIPLIWFLVPVRFDSAGGESESGEVAPAVGMGDLMRMPVFWWTAMVFALMAGISTAWTVHLVAFLGGLGIDQATQSSLLATQFWMGIPGALFWGMLADRVPLTLLYSVMLSSMAVIFGCYAVSTDPEFVKRLVVVYGFVAGGMIPLYMMLLGRRMGPDALGRAMGLSNLVMLPVMAVAVWLAALLFEAQGGYAISLMIFAGGMLAGIVSVFGSQWSDSRK